MFRLRPERLEDAAEAEMLLDLAFAPGRTALSSYRLRDGVEPVSDLSTVARDEFDALAGLVRYWPVRLGATGAPALLLGPIAVHPTRQGEGLGALLIAETLAIAADAGWQRCILIGDEPYYGRFGFSRRMTGGLIFPPPVNPDRFLGKELAPGAMATLTGPVERWGSDIDFAFPK